MGDYRPERGVPVQPGGSPTPADMGLGSMRQAEQLYRSSIDRAWSAITRFNDEHFPGWRKMDQMYMSNALAGEAGEAQGDALDIALATQALSAQVGSFADLVKHYRGGGTRRHPVTYVDLATELADCFVYLVLDAECLGLDASGFAAVVERKMVENLARMEARRTSGTEAGEP